MSDLKKRLLEKNRKRAGQAYSQKLFRNQKPYHLGISRNFSFTGNYRHNFNVLYCR